MSNFTEVNKSSQMFTARASQLANSSATRFDQAAMTTHDAKQHPKKCRSVVVKVTDIVSTNQHFAQLLCRAEDDTSLMVQVHREHWEEPDSIMYRRNRKIADFDKVNRVQPTIFTELNLWICLNFGAGGSSASQHNGTPFHIPTWRVAKEPSDIPFFIIKSRTDVMLPGRFAPDIETARISDIRDLKKDRFFSGHHFARVRGNSLECAFMESSGSVSILLMNTENFLTAQARQYLADNNGKLLLVFLGNVFARLSPVPGSAKEKVFIVTFEGFRYGSWLRFEPEDLFLQKKKVLNKNTAEASSAIENALSTRLDVVMATHFEPETNRATSTAYRKNQRVRLVNATINQDGGDMMTFKPNSNMPNKIAIIYHELPFNFAVYNAQNVRLLGLDDPSVIAMDNVFTIENGRLAVFDGYWEIVGDEHTSITFTHRRNQKTVGNLDDMEITTHQFDLGFSDDDEEHASVCDKEQRQFEVHIDSDADMQSDASSVSSHTSKRQRSLVRSGGLSDDTLQIKKKREEQPTTPGIKRRREDGSSPSNTPDALETNKKKYEEGKPPTSPATPATVPKETSQEPNLLQESPRQIGTLKNSHPINAMFLRAAIESQGSLRGPNNGGQ